MIFKSLECEFPLQRYSRNLYALLSFICVLLSCISLFVVSNHFPLTQTSILSSTDDTPFRLLVAQSNRTKPNGVSVTRIVERKSNFLNYYETVVRNQTQIPKMCSDIFSIGKTRSNMKLFTKHIVSYLRRVKLNTKFRYFLRHEPYILLGDMMPVMVNISTTNDSITQVDISKKWRMDQVSGLFPHLSCRLREYSTSTMKQCLASRGSQGKTTKLLFMGDSRVRQLVEVLLDIFRDLDFEVKTHEGSVLSNDEFLDLKASVLWTKYKKKFVARSKLEQNFEIEFYWTTIFDLETKNVFVAQPGDNTNESAVQEYLKSEGVVEETRNNTNNLFHKSLKGLEEETTTTTHLSPVKPQTIPIKYGSGKSPMNRTFTDTVGEHLDKFDTRDHYKYPQVSAAIGPNESISSPFGMDRSGNLPASSNFDGTLKTASFISQPLKRLKKLLTLAPTEVPDLIILGSDVWGIDNSNPMLRVLDEITLRQVEQLRPLLLRLRTITQLAWVMPQPVKDHMYPANEPFVHFTNIFMKNIEWVASAQVQLMAQGITVWDSFFPIASASIRDCVAALQNGNITLPSHPKLRWIQSWYCGDRIHNNNEAFVVAAQMVANQLCNEYMPHEKYCCEGG